MTLTWHEVVLGANIGILRHISAMKAGKHDRFGFTGLGWSEHCEGACGEVAVAKLLGRFWDGSINTWGNPDLGGRVQVRTRSRHDYELIVRDQDDGEDKFVLVTGSTPSFVVRGWCYGSEGKQAEWRQEHGGRAPAYFVPHSALRPMSTIDA